MKAARFLCAALALSLLAGWVAPSSACEDHKGTKVSKATASAKVTKTMVAGVSSKDAGCSAAMAASCTPEMMAACKASMAAGGPDLCTGAKASAASAAAHGSCAASKGATTNSSAKNSKGTKVSAAYVSAEGDDHCAGMKASATTAAAHGSCAAKGTSASAVTAANTTLAPTTIYLAGANGSCGTKGAKASSASAGSCSGHGMASVAATSGHADCDACLDMADCSGQLDAAGAHRQAVRLKNGIMFVYTADSPRTVNAVQAAVSRRAERMMRFANAGEKTRLCAECKTMRGAMASGKLTREVVNIEGGTLTLVTSTDPAVVAKIHAMADDKVATRTKS